MSVFGGGAELTKTFDLLHMLVSVAKMALPMSFLLDVVILAIVGSPILIVKYLATPNVLGFFCSDEVRPIYMNISTNNLKKPQSRLKRM